MMPRQKFSDHSNDRKYFVLTPRIVWALCDSPYEYTLWGVVKDVAGEEGECFLSTLDLATLAMMSVGKLSYTRSSLISKKLLDGAVVRDPGFPQPVWHLKVPDLWEANVDWCKKYPLIRDRVGYKTSFHVVKASPHEGGTPLHEGGTPPHETKNNRGEPIEEHTATPKINPNTGRVTAAKVLGDPVDGILAAAKMAQKIEADSGLDAEVYSRIQDFPADVQAILEELCRLSGVIPPEPVGRRREGKYAEWIRELRQLLRASQEYKVPDFRVPLRATWKTFSDDGLTFGSPASLYSNFGDECRKMKQKAARPAPPPVVDEGRKLVTPSMVKR